MTEINQPAINERSSSLRYGLKKARVPLNAAFKSHEVQTIEREDIHEPSEKQNLNSLDEMKVMGHLKTRSMIQLMTNNNPIFAQFLSRSCSDRRVKRKDKERAEKDMIKLRFASKEQRNLCHVCIPARVILNQQYSRFLNIDSSINYQTLRCRVQQKFSLKPEDSFVLNYIDEEGEFVRIVDDEDIKVAIREHVSNQSKLILYVDQVQH
jgi:hypothetical protein